jgi:hypothetical protein
MDAEITGSGPVVVTPEPARFRISPLGFHQRACEFVDASKLLSEKAGRFSFVAAFLACRGIELALKAYLLARGDSIEEVKGLRHDLSKTLVESYARGMDVVVNLTSQERELVMAINGDYVENKFAYFDLFSAVVAPKNPDLHQLPAIASKILDGIERGCYEAGDANWKPFP